MSDDDRTVGDDLDALQKQFESSGPKGNWFDELKIPPTPPPPPPPVDFMKVALVSRIALVLSVVALLLSISQYVKYLVPYLP